MAVSSFPYGVFAVGNQQVSVQLPILSLGTNNTSFPCRSGIELRADGTIYGYNSLGITLEEQITIPSGWLLEGSNTQVWVECTLNSGTLSNNAGTGTRLAMTSDRLWDTLDSDSGSTTAEASITLEFYDASSGGNLLASRTYNLSADYESGGGGGI